MLIQDSNSKRWTLDKDVDVYGIWIDCDRSNPKSPQYMDPVPFALESSSHQSEKATSIPTLKANPKVKKFLQDGQLILQWEGRQFDFLGRENEKCAQKCAGKAKNGKILQIYLHI